MRRSFFALLTLVAACKNPAAAALDRVRRTPNDFLTEPPLTLAATAVQMY